MTVRASGRPDPFTNLEALLAQAARTARTPDSETLKALGAATAAATAFEGELRSLGLDVDHFRQASPDTRQGLLQRAHEARQSSSAFRQTATTHTPVFEASEPSGRTTRAQLVSQLEGFEGFRLASGDGLRIIGDFAGSTGSIGFHPANDFVELIHAGDSYAVRPDELPANLRRLYDTYHQGGGGTFWQELARTSWQVD